MKNSNLKKNAGKKLSLNSFRKQQVSNLQVDAQAGGAATTSISPFMPSIVVTLPKPGPIHNDCH